MFLRNTFNLNIPPSLKNVYILLKKKEKKKRRIAEIPNKAMSFTQAARVYIKKIVHDGLSWCISVCMLLYIHSGFTFNCFSINWKPNRLPPELSPCT